MNFFYGIVVFGIIIFFGGIYVYWRYFFFFNDPERIIPDGNSMVSPADGTIVYVRKVLNSSVPISIKGKIEIKLEEITKYNISGSVPYYILGIFMHPTDVHVNRAPLAGIVEKIIYTKAKNLPMTMMWWRVLFSRKPYELYSKHILNNERNTILIRGILPVYIIQIADIYVNKIECWFKEGDSVDKGQRIGMIKMGSQVDVIFPYSQNIEILVAEGDKVKAGETVLANINTDSI